MDLNIKVSASTAYRYKVASRQQHLQSYKNFKA
jgi:hypothetical protein